MESNTTFCCDVCNKVFSKAFNLTRHKKTVCNRESDKSFKCEHCDRNYNLERTLDDHMKKVHNIKSNFTSKYMLCSEPPCFDRSFLNMNDLRNHRKEVHGKDINKDSYTFLSFDEFNQWKDHIEAESGIQYSKKSSDKFNSSTNTSKNIYYCRRSGHFTSRGTGKKLKKQGSVKIGRHCTSTINVTKTGSGVVIVDYYSDHCGHEMGPEAIVYTGFSQKVKQAVVNKLFQNIPVKKIIEDIKGSNLGPKCLSIQGQDIRNIAKEFGLDISTKQKRGRKEVKQNVCDQQEVDTAIKNILEPDISLQINKSNDINFEERLVSLSNPSVNKIITSIDPSNEKLKKILQPKVAQTEVNTISIWPTSHCKMSNLKYLDQDSAIALNADLINEYMFSIQQVTEVAGQACARAIANIYPIQEGKQVLIVCGPGNNGGDGLVCARYLKLLGYSPCVVYPSDAKNKFFITLISQCVNYGIPILKAMQAIEMMGDNFQILVDAVFGHGFKSPVEPEFVSIISTMQQSRIPIVSVDIPSGWDVNNGPVLSVNGTKVEPLKPDMLISLSLPKVCSKFFKGSHHILGGLIVPPALATKYKIEMPRTTELSQIIVLK